MTASMELNDRGIKMFGAMTDVTANFFWKASVASKSDRTWLSRSTAAGGGMERTDQKQRQRPI